MGSKASRAESPASPGAIFALIRGGAATTRREVARATGLAPSTASLRVEELIDAGWVSERTDGSMAGRPARRLAVNRDRGIASSISLGANHMSVDIADATGASIATRSIPYSAVDGPASALDFGCAQLAEIISESGSTAALLGVTLGLPTPIDATTGTATASIQAPGWDRLDILGELRSRVGGYALVENDANLLAVAALDTVPVPNPHLIAVKAGSRIGSGFVSGGVLHRGASGAGGEFSHTPTGAASVIACSCGNSGCLESVASGAAVVARLRALGADVTTVDEIVTLAGHGDAVIIELVRTAGSLVGEVLAQAVNFVNPHAVILGGAMSSIPDFVASVRAVLFQHCLPVVSSVLSIREIEDGSTAEGRGGIRLLLDAILSPDAIDADLTASRTAITHP
ncbi:ROK family transcriptional regulator [Microbacterium phyllosphaerae]|uniref:ROK family transcriptional regulator n=1 Tax=Microbacterium phyllosphaerae TaxID=124798 RepID=UPI003D6608B1